MSFAPRPPTPDALYDGIVKSLTGDDPEYLSVCVRALKVPGPNIRIEGVDILSLAIRYNARHCIDIMKRLTFELDRLSAKDGKHPLEEALDANSMVALECLLRAGSNPNGPHTRYGTIMHAAAATRTVDSLIPVLCAKQGNPNAVSERDGSTPLHVAVARSQPLNVEQLLERGALTNVVDNLGRTPLHLAMGIDDYERIVDLLLNFGGDALIADGGELTVIDLAEVREEPALIKMLKERASWEAQLAHQEIHGRNRPLKADDFRKELLQAVIKGNQNTIRDLFDIRGGELWKPVTSAAQSPLLTAFANKRLDIAALLISRRAGIYDRDEEKGGIAHYFLASTVRPDAVRAFLPVIHSINAAYLTEHNQNGHPPLEAAVLEGQEHDTAAVQELIESLLHGQAAEAPAPAEEG